ncbi:MAG: hypothetical protein KF729_32050, partial [Sandaracinaceae bacterium]|nr:hypothetical protein [Sandaracinaceae bacterium]
PERARAGLVAASPDQITAARKGRDAARGAGLPWRAARRVPPRIRCGWGCGVDVRGSASREALGRVRARLRPAVRACFRDARAGRASWSARATLTLQIEQGELVAAAVTQTTDARLAACLSHVADDFDDIPPSSGRVEVHLPFVARGVAPTEPAPIGPGLEHALRAIGF